MGIFISGGRSSRLRWRTALSGKVNKRSIADVDLGGTPGRTAIVRADLNVPLDGGDITDEEDRLRSPRLEYSLRLDGASCCFLTRRPKE